MKLIPESKPIKIRIKVGDEEFSTLNALKKNFSFNDLYNLRGTLTRWLIQIGEISTAEKLKAAVESESGDDTLLNYIMFLSVFFEDIPAPSELSSSTPIKTSKEYITIAPFETLQFIYKLTSNVTNSNIDWLSYFKLKLTPENINQVLERNYALFSGKLENLFVELTRNESDFAKMLPILEEYYLSKRRPDIKWEIVFANIVNERKSEFENIERILLQGATYIDEFYQYCVNYGIKKAKDKIDPWKTILHNHTEYEIVLKALNKWSLKKREEEILSYREDLQSSLARQIINLLNSMTYLDRNDRWDRNDENERYYLHDEKEVLLECKNRKWKNGRNCYYLDSDQRRKLQQSRNKYTDYFIKNEIITYDTLCRYIISKLKERLESYNKKSFFAN